MPKKAGMIFVITGAVLMLSALLLFLYNGYEERRAGQQAELLVAELQTMIAEQPQPVPEPEDHPVTMPQAESAVPETEIEAEISEPEETIPAEMPVVMLDGYDYIGWLSIPDLGLALPVMAEWDYERLKIAPCRHFGSSRTDDLVIAAHNYRTHFGSLASLSAGAEVVFTDMDGVENRYQLAEAPILLPPEAVDAVQNSGHDLVLYTCTPGNAQRVAAFCDRAAEESGGGF